MDNVLRCKIYEFKAIYVHSRVVEKYFEEEKRIIDLRLIIIYTGDVEKAAGIMETSCFSLRMEQAFLFANLMVASDKFIDKKFSDEIGRWLKMTKIARAIAEEAIEERDKEIVVRMLLRGYKNAEIAVCTGLTFEEVEIIKKESVKIFNA